MNEPELRWGGGDAASGRIFDIDERLKQLSAMSEAMERLNSVVDFERFRAELERAVPRSDRSKGGRAPFDHGLMFKALILQSSHDLSDERTPNAILGWAGRAQPEDPWSRQIQAYDRFPRIDQAWDK